MKCPRCFAELEGTGCHCPNGCVAGIEPPRDVDCPPPYRTAPTAASPSLPELIYVPWGGQWLKFRREDKP